MVEITEGSIDLRERLREVHEGVPNLRRPSSQQHAQKGGGLWSRPCHAHTYLSHSHRLVRQSLLYGRVASSQPRSYFSPFVTSQVRTNRTTSSSIRELGKRGKSRRRGTDRRPVRDHGKPRSSRHDGSRQHGACLWHVSRVAQRSGGERRRRHLARTFWTVSTARVYAKIAVRMPEIPTSMVLTRSHAPSCVRFPRATDPCPMLLLPH